MVPQKVFEAPQRSVKINIYVNFLSASKIGMVWVKSYFHSGKVEGACQKEVIFPYLECCPFYKRKVSISLFLVCFGSSKIINFNK